MNYWLHRYRADQPPDCVGDAETIAAFRADHSDDLARLERAYAKRAGKKARRLGVRFNATLQAAMR